MRRPQLVPACGALRRSGPRIHTSGGHACRPAAQTTSRSAAGSCRSPPSTQFCATGPPPPPPRRSLSTSCCCACLAMTHPSAAAAPSASPTHPPPFSAASPACSPASSPASSPAQLLPRIPPRRPLQSPQIPLPPHRKMYVLCIIEGGARPTTPSAAPTTCMERVVCRADASTSRRALSREPPASRL